MDKSQAIRSSSPSPQVIVKAAQDEERQPFWSKHIKDERKETVKGMLSGLLLITVILWIALPIFWGSLWLLLRYFSQLVITVVDFESPLLGENAAVGPMMIQMAEQTNLQTMRPHLGFAVTQASAYPNGPSDVKEVIGYSNYWGAIVVYPNCTSTWRTSLQNGLADYDPTGCVGVFYSGARFYQVSLLYLAPFMKRFAEQILQTASTQAVSQYLSSIQGNTTALALLANVPQALTTPFSLYEEDVRPINQWGAAAPFEAALIYYLITSFILVMWGAQARQKAGWEKKLTFPSLFLWRIGVPAACYFVMSLSFSLLFKAFLIPTSAAFGNGGGFFALWMLNWCCLLAVGLVLESMVSLLSPTYLPFFLIIWIILNITSAFQPIELMEKFYRFLRWLPFYHTVEGYKIIAYKTRPPHEIGLNFGALIAVAAVAVIGNFVFLAVERRREEKDLKKEDEKQ